MGRAHCVASRSAEDTRALGERLGAALVDGDVVALTGELGAGKTTFARAFIAARAKLASLAPPAEIPSPTFTLVQTYELPGGAVWHIDLYRLERPEHARELAIEEGFAEAIVLIEWPERLGALLPKDRLEVALAYGSDAGARTARLTGFGAWAARLAGLGAEIGDG